MKSDSGISKVTVFNPQESDCCSEEVFQEVEEIWRWQKLVNDTSVFKTTINQLKTFYKIEAKAIVQHLEQQGVSADEEIWIHWWW